MLDTSCISTVKNKYKNLLQIQKEIVDFDQHPPETLVVNKNTHNVLQRLMLPFEQLVNQVKDLHVERQEFDILDQEENVHARKVLRGRLCKLWSIQKMCSTFYTPSRRINIIGPIGPFMQPHERIDLLI